MKLSELFDINYGSKGYDNKSILDKGSIPLIASQGVDHGVHGFYNVPKEYHPPIITVPRTGSIGFAFLQLKECNITDDCMVLIPKTKLTIEYLFYIVAMIRISKWRFNYARKITPKRLGKVEVIPEQKFKVKLSYGKIRDSLYPKTNTYTDINLKEPQLKSFNITKLFDLKRGHFHAIDRLKKGTYPTVSRVSQDNGVVGFYKKPVKAKVFSKHLITVSTVTGDAFIQYTPFIATDNTVICIPKIPFKITTLIYIQSYINKVRWRYSYGRQCYKRIFKKTVIFLPVTSENRIDEKYLEKIVMNQPYWQEFKKRLLN